MAFDGDPNTFWEASFNAPDEWIQIDLHTRQALSQYKVLTFDENDYPAAWSFQGSYDSLQWHNVYSTDMTNQDSSSDQARQYGVLGSNPIPYRFYRWKITSCAGSTLRVREIYLISPTHSE